MKKITALVLSLMMVLCAFGALAEGETVEKTGIGILNVGETFVIQSKIPEGYSFEPFAATDLGLIGSLTAEDMSKPVIVVSIAYNEEYADIERFNDLSEEDVEYIRWSFQDEEEAELIFEDLETAHGTRLLKVIDVDYVDLYTIYKGYEMEFLMTHPDPENEITEADIQMLVDFISDMDFVAVE